MNPYQNLGNSCFWSTAVAKKNVFDLSGLWTPKFEINKDMKIASFGSCFAQHIGTALRLYGLNWLCTEKAPNGICIETAKLFNYELFSARTGNIYTASQLRQWIDWALDYESVPNEVWEKDKRFIDPFRPTVEPIGFDSIRELEISRKFTVQAFKKTLLESDIFVFTLGLTETWVNKNYQYEYPMCPGTIAGVFDEKEHIFVNQKFPFIRQQLAEVIKKVRAVNNKIKFILTVSPVPLTATMSDKHILVANSESKSTLRAIAGLFAEQFAFVDYFPSYELINMPISRGVFFEPNQRNINSAGVEFVMKVFFRSLELGKYTYETNEHRESSKKVRYDDNSCDEEILNKFSNYRQ